jgi:TP901 family phage tail tape measure protein
MAVITEKIGFDVSSGISNLRKLKKEIRSLNTSLGTLKKKVDSFDGGGGAASLNKLAGAADKAGNSAQKAGEKLKKAGEKGTKSANSMTISWETFSRVIFTQVVVRALTALIGKLGEASAVAKEFEEDVTRISLISAEGAEGAGDLAAAFEQMAVTLGRPITEITEAGMEALQNDLGTTAETMKLMEGAAADLALVTKSQLVDSVNSISSVMKAYNLDISQAADISDTFYTAIDKGRISLDQLSSRLGTVEPQAAALNLRFHESVAATAALTLSGLNAQTAMTQLRNIYAKMIKPTDELQAAFKRLGVETGTQLIAKMGGLQGALQALRREAGGNEQAVAKMFGTIRGQLGVLNLISDEGGKYAQVLAAMEDRAGKAAAGAEVLNNTLSKLQDREVEKLNRSLRKVGAALNFLKTSFLTGLNLVIGVVLPDDEIKEIEKKSTKKLKEIGEKATKDFNKAALKILAEAQEEIAIAERRGVSGEALEVLKESVEQVAMLEIAAKAAEIAIQGDVDTILQLQSTLASMASNTAKLTSYFGGDRDFVKNNSQELLKLFRETAQADGEKLDAIREEISGRERGIRAAFKSQKINEATATSALKEAAAVRMAADAREDILKAKRIAGRAQDEVAEPAAIEESLIDGITALDKFEDKFDQVHHKVNTDAMIPQIDNTPAMAALDAILNKYASVQAKMINDAKMATGAPLSAPRRAPRNMPLLGMYKGGKLGYFNAGGAARGADSVPAMLAKGESVNNARSTRAFFSQIQAMNSGQRAARRETSSTSNFGDIHVNVTGGAGSEDPESFGRLAASSIRRELRRQSTAL